jgi:hypothetical protein
MPPWDFETMTPEMEALREEAEGLSAASRHSEAAAAWDRLGTEAIRLYGSEDIRSMASLVRLIRSAFEAGELTVGHFIMGQPVLIDMLRISAPGSPEGLYAAETAALLQWEEGDAPGARDIMSDLAKASAITLGPEHPQTLSVKDWLSRIPAGAEGAPPPGAAPSAAPPGAPHGGIPSSARPGAFPGGSPSAAQPGASPVGGPSLGQYMPPWAQEAMTPELEALRSEAELRQDQRDPKTALAWSALGAGASRAYGPQDPRAAAAFVRAFRSVAARSVAARGDRLDGALERADSIAAAAAAFQDPGAPEALFAAETAGILRLAGGDAEGARDVLQVAARASVFHLGPEHPQTLSLRGWVARAAAFGAFPYRPTWTSGSATPELDAARAEAEGLSDEGRHLEASLAWERCAVGVRDLYGMGDARALAAASRLARANIDAGTRHRGEAEAATRLVGMLAQSAGPASPETLYASESEALLRRDGGDPAGARALLEKTAAASA